MTRSLAWRPSRRSFIVGGGAGLAVGRSGALAAPATLKGKTSKVVMGIGLSAPFLSHIALVEQGIGKKHGINAEYKIFESGIGGLDALLSGNAHLAVGTEISIPRPRLSGGKIVVAARSLVAKRDQGIAVGPGIESPKDFKGKKFAVIRTTGADYLLSRFLLRHGLKEGSGPDEVQIVNVQPAEWIAAISRGDIQGFFGWQPWLDKLPMIVPGSRVYAYASEDNLYNQWLYTAFQEDWARQDPDSAGATYAAMGEATDWVEANRAEAIKMGARIFRIKPDDFKVQVDGVDFVWDTRKEFYPRFKDMIGWAVEKGYLKTNDIDKLISDSLYIEIAKKYAPERTDF